MSFIRAISLYLRGWRKVGPHAYERRSKDGSRLEMMINRPISADKLF